MNRWSYSQSDIKINIVLFIPHPGVKIGRHTYEQKTADILEVKKLELQDRITKSGSRCEELKRHAELDKVIARMVGVHISKNPQTTNDFLALCHAEEQFLVYIKSHFYIYIIVTELYIYDNGSLHTRIFLPTRTFPPGFPPKFPPRHEMYNKK